MASEESHCIKQKSMLLSFSMQNVRTFIAVSLPEEIHGNLSKVSDLLKRNIGDGVVRWVSPSNIHLTMRFLGEIPAGDITQLKTGLEDPVAQHATFPLTVQKIGVFPNARRPRVIWAGLKDSNALIELYTTVENVMRELGYDSEERPFSAHLTLGRISQAASVQQTIHCGEIISACTVGELGSFIVKSVDIYRSELNAGGSIYTRLHALSLRKES
jgi:RNA 2',3'-cyclic 3'-phosphodiesterase